MESEACHPALEPGLACGLLWATEYTEVTPELQQFWTLF